jgi:molybdopterin-guanine dinucleotide biosynthesis protein A
MADAHEMTGVTAAILVGGRGERLGRGPKPLLRVGTRTILDRQLLALRDAGVHRILLVGRWSHPPVTGVQHVPDVLDASGALVGLYSALLASTMPIVIVMAGDLPFVSPELLGRLADLKPEEDAVVPRAAGRWHPLCAAYRRRTALRIKARIDRGELRASALVSDLRVHALAGDELTPLDPDGMGLMNVNTPDDLRRADQRARLSS